MQIVDQRNGLVTLTVRRGAFVTPAMIREALRPTYQLAKLEVELQGRIQERRRTYWFTPAGVERGMIQLGTRDLPPERREEAMAPFRALESALGESYTTFVVKGEVRDDGRGRNVSILLEEARPVQTPREGEGDGG